MNGATHQGVLGVQPRRGFWRRQFGEATTRAQLAKAYEAMTGLDIKYRLAVRSD